MELFRFSLVHFIANGKKNMNDSRRIDAIAAVINAFVRASQRQEEDVNGIVGADDWGV